MSKIFKHLTRYNYYKRYFLVAKRDKYAVFYATLKGNIDEENIRKKSKKYNLTQQEEDILVKYMKKEKISVIAKSENVCESYIHELLDRIYMKFHQLK